MSSHRETPLQQGPVLLQPNTAQKPADGDKEETYKENAEKNSIQNRSWVVVHKTETAVDMNDTQVQQKVVTIQKHMHRLTKFIHIFEKDNIWF